MIHEHQSPLGEPIKWNKDVVYAELRNTNGWDRQMVDHNMFKQYGDWQLCENAKKLEGTNRVLSMDNFCKGELVNGSKYDPTSVMHYFFPESWILEGPPIPVNLTYSKDDEEWIRQYYGEPVPPPITETVTEKVTETKEAVEEKVVDTPPEISAIALTFGVLIIVALVAILMFYAGQASVERSPVSPFKRPSLQRGRRLTR